MKEFGAAFHIHIKFLFPPLTSYVAGTSQNSKNYVSLKNDIIILITVAAKGTI